MDISILVRTFVAVFVLADALGNTPIFLILTKGMDAEQRNKVVDRVFPSAMCRHSVIFVDSLFIKAAHVSLAVRNFV